MKSQPESAALLDRIEAASHWQGIDFVSDLHLAENTPATVQGFIQYLQHSPADAIVLLGDIFEVWVGDDARHDAFESSLCQALFEASRSKAVYFMAGNRDFLLGADMAAAAGMQRLSDPCVLAAFGQRWLLSHGDAWCLEDTSYQAFRLQVRSSAWQQQFLSLALEQRRQIARDLRAQSEARKRSASASELWADLDAPRCISELQTHDCQALIHGHTHRPGVHTLHGKLQRHVLSDWDLDQPPHRSEVLRLSPKGLQRVPVASAASMTQAR